MIQRSLNAARAAYRKARKLAPKLPDPYLNLARLDLIAKQPGKARVEYEALLAERPDNPAALVALARMALADHRREEAFVLLERARARNPRDLASRVLLTALYARAGQPSKQLELARESQRLHPENLSATRLLVEALWANGKRDRARRMLEDLAVRHPQALGLELLLGAMLAEQGDPDARRPLERVLARDAENPEARVALARLALHQNDPKSAMGEARRIQQAHPESATGFALAGDILRASGRDREAISAYEKALALEPAGRYVLALVSIEDRLGNPDRARARLSRWLSAHPDSASIQQALAQRAQAAGKPSQALEGYAAVLARDPDNVIALNNTAWLFEKDEPAKALEYAERAASGAPGNPFVLDTLGWMQLRTGRTEQATRTLQRAVKLSPGYSEHRYHLAVALARSGDRRGARAILEEILADQADFPGRAGAETLRETLGM